MIVEIRIKPDFGGDARGFGMQSFDFRNDETEVVNALRALFVATEWNVRQLMRDPSHVVKTPPFLEPE